MVVFRQLDRQSLHHIADLVLADTALQLAKKNIKLEVAPTVMAKIVEQGYDQVFTILIRKPIIQSCISSCSCSCKSSCVYNSYKDAGAP